MRASGPIQARFGGALQDMPVLQFLRRILDHKADSTEESGDPESAIEPTPAERVQHAARLHRDGMACLAAARREVARLYPYSVASEDFVLQQAALCDGIEKVLEAYRADPAAYKYFHGFPYQALGIAGVFGDRVCDYRFDTYELRKFIRPTDSVLDIGCNCGFMSVLASYRIGCRTYGVDINPYMIQIGQLVASYLRISDLVHLRADDLTTFQMEQPVDVVMSFATHWTDDENYRVSIEEHMQRMAGYLKENGTLIFETHCNDVGVPSFYEAMDNVKSRFSFDSCYKLTDSDTRELYIMRRR